MRRSGRAVHAHLAGAPAAVAYSFTLFITWWTLRGVSDSAAHRLILSASTNLHNLRREPVQVLVASAFWTDGGFPWTTILIFVTLMAFAERWLGSVRWILVFAGGHVGATLLVATGLSYAVHHQLIPVHIVMTTDVGTSYGTTAVLGALTYHLRGIPRALWAAILVCWYGFAAWHNRTFTDYGHAIALCIGLVVGAFAVTVALRLERLREHRPATPNVVAPQSNPTTEDPAAVAGSTGGRSQSPR